MEQSAKEWYDDVKDYHKTLDDSTTKEWVQKKFIERYEDLKIEKGFFTYIRPGPWELSISTKEKWIS